MAKKSTKGRKYKTTSLVIPPDVLEMIPPISRKMMEMDESLISVDVSKAIRFCIRYTFAALLLTTKRRQA